MRIAPVNVSRVRPVGLRRVRISLLGLLCRQKRRCQQENRYDAGTSHPLHDAFPKRKLHFGRLRISRGRTLTENREDERRPLFLPPSLHCNSYQNPWHALSSIGWWDSSIRSIYPEEIESIEIIKGPAAATLYGTQASAGVIQIITKRGEVGAPQFDIMVRQGANWLPHPERWTADQTDRFTGEAFNIYEVEKAAGRPIFQNGYIQSYNVGMRGGTDAVRYFLSADYHDNEGIVDYNYDERTSIRGNVGGGVNEQFSLDVSTGYVTGFTSFLEQRNAFGVLMHSGG